MKRKASFQRGEMFGELTLTVRGLPAYPLLLLRYRGEPSLRLKSTTIKQGTRKRGRKREGGKKNNKEGVSLALVLL